MAMSAVTSAAYVAINASAWTRAAITRRSSLSSSMP
jgi:hypothetical protein